MTTTAPTPYPAGFAGSAAPDLETFRALARDRQPHVLALVTEPRAHALEQRLPVRRQLARA